MCGRAGGGDVEKTLESTQTTLFEFWVSKSLSSGFHQEKPLAGNLTPTGSQIKDWQKGKKM